MATCWLDAPAGFGDDLERSSYMAPNALPSVSRAAKAPGLLPLVMRRARQARQSSRAAEHARTTGDEAQFFFGDSLGALREQLEKILAADRRLQTRLPPVLITGETGTGKSSVARWLHRNGPRAAQPLIEVNCSALPETLAESELFGHERGAFTDARTARQGLFEAAHGGTLFLDELPSLSAAC